MQGHWLETKNAGCNYAVGGVCPGKRGRRGGHAGNQVNRQCRGYEDAYDPEWINSIVSDQRQSCFVPYREQREVICCYQKKLSKSTRFKAMALPPAGDEGNLRQWKRLVFSCLVSVCQHKTTPWPLMHLEALCRSRLARW